MSSLMYRTTTTQKDVSSVVVPEEEAAKAWKVVWEIRKAVRQISEYAVTNEKSLGAQKSMRVIDEADKNISIVAKKRKQLKHGKWYGRPVMLLNNFPNTR